MTLSVVHTMPVMLTIGLLRMRLLRMLLIAVLHADCGNDTLMPYVHYGYLSNALIKSTPYRTKIALVFNVLNCIVACTTITHVFAMCTCVFSARERDTSAYGKN